MGLPLRGLLFWFGYLPKALPWADIGLPLWGWVFDFGYLPQGFALGLHRVAPSGLCFIGLATFPQDFALDWNGLPFLGWVSAWLAPVFRGDPFGFLFFVKSGFALRDGLLWVCSFNYGPKGQLYVSPGRSPGC